MLIAILVLIEASIFHLVQSEGVQPIVIEPSGRWDGFDGPWSTFDIQLGTPPQSIAVLPATFMSEIWVWNKKSCSENPETCFTGFSGFSPDDSSSFRQWNSTVDLNGNQTSMHNGNESFSLGMYEDFYSDSCSGYMSKLGYNGSVIHSRESLEISVKDAIPIQSSVSSYILDTKDPGIGLLGMNQKFCRSRNPKAKGYRGPENGEIEPNKQLAPNLIQSLLDSAQERGLGRVWSYTAGSYNLGSKSVLASLTFGGFDSSRLERGSLRRGDAATNLSPFDKPTPNNLSFTVRSYMHEGKGKMNTNERTWTSTFNIDTSRVDSVFPGPFCQQLESFLGVKRDNATQFLLVDETNHDRLLKWNPSIILEVSLGRGQSYYSNPVIFDFPYRDLVLSAKPPVIPFNSYYIPIRCGGVTSQPYTLGRAFMQKAYIIVTEGKWYIGRARNDPFAKPYLVPVRSSHQIEEYKKYSGTTKPSYNADMGRRPLKWEEVVGIVLASLVAGSVLMLLFALWERKRRLARLNATMMAKEVALPPPPEYCVDTVDSVELSHLEPSRQPRPNSLPPYSQNSPPPYRFNP